MDQQNSNLRTSLMDRPLALFRQLQDPSPIRLSVRDRQMEEGPGDSVVFVPWLDWLRQPRSL